MSAVVRELELKLKELQEQLEYAEVEKSNAQIQLNSCRADLVSGTPANSASRYGGNATRKKTSAKQS